MSGRGIHTILATGPSARPEGKSSDKIVQARRHYTSRPRLATRSCEETRGIKTERVDYFNAHSTLAGIKSTAMSLSAGDRLGPYEILEKIGTGGMGEVYRARDTRLAREGATKISADRV